MIETGNYSVFSKNRNILKEIVLIYKSILHQITPNYTNDAIAPKK